MKRRMLYALAGILLCGISLAARKDERIEKLMERTHEGKRSPLRQVSNQLSANAPAWDVVDRQLPAFDEMSRVLAAARNADIRDSADGYVAAVKDLATAAKGRNLAGARKALQALRQSCGDCHYKGGPGGRLEDDDDD